MKTANALILSMTILLFPLMNRLPEIITALNNAT